jgi:hypothetical protein
MVAVFLVVICQSTGTSDFHARRNRTEHGGSRIWMLRKFFSERDTQIFSEQIF